MTKYRNPPDGGDWVFSRFVTRNGKRIYHPSGGLYRFPARPRRPK